MHVVLALLLAVLPALAAASAGSPCLAQATETERVSPNATHDALGGDDVEYLTNAQHQRIGRRVNGGPWTWWLYAGGLTPVAEYDADFRLRKVFVYGPGHAPDHVITYDTAGLQTARYRFVTDQAGSILGLVDDAGAWVLAYDYTPFGRRTLLSAAPGIDESLTPFGFAAGDPTTRLVRFGARDYDPHTARWMAKDPIDFAGGDTNLYAYVGGDPINLVDPSGLASSEAIARGLHVLFGWDPAESQPVIELAAGEIAAQAVEFMLAGLVIKAARLVWRGGRWVVSATRARRSICFGDAISGAAPRAAARVCSGPGCICFVAGTPVATADGPRPIEEVEEGDLVLSKGEETGEVAYRPVARTFVNQDKQVIDLYVVDDKGNGSTLGVTPEHPFWVFEKGWVQAGELLPGDELFTSRGGWLRVTGGTWRPETATVYNFEVAEFHTYLAEEAEAWVHNVCDPTKPAREVLPGRLRREFPAEHLDKSLNDIKAALSGASGQAKRSLQKAKKLLEQVDRLMQK